MYIYIRSMSEAQSKIYDKLTDASWRVDQHIVKLLLLPDCQEANHWKREIARFIDHTSKLQRTNKWPTARFIKKCLSTHNDMVDALLRQVSNSLKETNKRDISAEDVLWALNTYQDWLASQLSTRGAIDYEDAYEVLDAIVDQTR